MRDKDAGTERWFDPEEISDSGERVSHLVKDFTFYGHLTIYVFAKQFCHDSVVLDAGSGAGYGAALLADAGARHVFGVDASPKAVAFSKQHFSRPNLEFETRKLEELTLPAHAFDFIFTSNTLEHVADVPHFLRLAHASLKSTGSMLVAVPPITNDRLIYLNLTNRYHLNIWSPRQWDFVLQRFFGHVQPFVHGVSERALAHASGRADATSALSEDDFTIAPATLDDLYNLPTLTAIFVATAPRAIDALPGASSKLTFVDDSFSRPPFVVDSLSRPLGDIPAEVETRLKPYFEPPSDSPVAGSPSPVTAPPQPNVLRRAWFVWRTAGTRAAVRKTIRVLTRALSRT